MELLRAEQHQKKRPKHAWEQEPRGIATFTSVSMGASFKLGRSEHMLWELRAQQGLKQVDAIENVKLPVLPYAARRAKMMDWPEIADDMKRKSLHLVRIMVESDFHATKLGTMLYELSGSLDKEPQIQRTIELTFAKKAAATLHKRTLAFWKMFVFHVDRGHKSGLHMSESSIFLYFESLQGGSATAPQSALESIFFMHTLLGIKAPIEDLVSHRIRGLVHEAAITKRPLKQARGLTVEEVRFLEKLVAKSPDTAVVCMAGFFLYALTNSARWGDAQASTLPTIDASGSRPVLSSGTLRHKLASTAERKTTLLPFVGFGQLVTGTAWAPKWLDAMKRARLPRTGVDYMLPSWNESSSQFIRRRMTSGEATLHLREILSQMEHPPLQPLPSSHSLKVTLLAWMCKSGLFSLSERQIIGHHLDRPSTSALTYGRANFVGPLGKVAGMLTKIQDGSFRPDASAADLIEQQLHQEEVASDELERKLHGAPCACEDSASDDMGHDDADQAVSAAVPAAERRMVEAPDPDQYLVHLSSGTLHALDPDSDRFRCGRPKTPNYVRPKASTSSPYPFCLVCQRAQDAGGQAAAAS
ncbi:unnamed protein product [Symbiodinium sp. CCMP2592]|nr:unnamed protein product [Symbiodinium sp. CCMP2592]